ncbi:AraC family transcriptional regulator [Salmonella enterica subsp. enterica]|uniref:AraC family transcriptional regulator n=1 Tax=Salmonella enterica I TaxID=59201 RepID=A0A447MTT1_SALET|nr:AraC family transcriptional regulator [Salmonella enterica subsp. enterica]
MEYIRQWASVFAMSERNLARLVVKETGLSFSSAGVISCN